MAPMGRASIFRGKTDRVQGLLTKIGSRQFNAAARKLAAIYQEEKGHKPDAVSDGDVIEFLARGEENTREYLRTAGKIKGK